MVLEMLRDIISSLQEVESAYNHIITFERVVDQLKVQLAIEHPRPFEQPQFFRKPYKPMRIRIPSSKTISNFVLPDEQLVLIRVQISSPGFWEFLGKLNPLEVIRQWMCDAHERRKDREYREVAEQEHLTLENQLLQNRVIHERIQILRELGTTDADIAPLLNQLIYEPLRRTEAHQDKGIFFNAGIKRFPENE